MYIDSCTTGKYARHLLRESYRKDGLVKKRTIANLSACSEEEIEAMRLALKYKRNLVELVSVSEDISLQQGLSIGATWLIYDMARQLGITEALGSSREGKLALWQVIARVIDQGSRLSAVRLAGSHAACDILGLDSFNEDDLYDNLDWLCDNQVLIEDRHFRLLHPDKKPKLFLYDVTSSYLEGICNELAAFGYNRDGKKGKRQIVIGLLCDENGTPLSIEVFVGNTQDPATVASQIRKVAWRFGADEVTFVGDRGMIKSRQVEDLIGHGFHYITAITKPQIESLLADDVLQMSLFDQDLAEVETEDDIRYILRCNPVRSEEIQQVRDSKLRCLEKAISKQNEYLAEHPRALVDVALRKVKEKCDKMRISAWVTPTHSGREISFSQDQSALAEISKLDGCYVLKTDLKKEKVSKETIHARYKDLSLVEHAFRTIKTGELELRPVNVRTAKHTRGHALVVMLSYCIVQELAKRWHDVELTVEEGINELAMLCATEVLVTGRPRCNQIPVPRLSVQNLLKKAKVRLPEALPCSGVRVVTRKKLAKRREKP